MHKWANIENKRAMLFFLDSEISNWPAEISGWPLWWEILYLTVPDSACTSPLPFSFCKHRGHFHCAWKTHFTESTTYPSLTSVTICDVLLTKKYRKVWRKWNQEESLVNWHFQAFQTILYSIQLRLNCVSKLGLHRRLVWVCVHTRDVWVWVNYQRERKR